MPSRGFSLLHAGADLYFGGTGGGGIAGGAVMKSKGCGGGAPGIGAVGGI